MSDRTDRVICCTDDTCCAPSKLALNTTSPDTTCGCTDDCSSNQSEIRNHEVSSSRTQKPDGAYYCFRSKEPDELGSGFFVSKGSLKLYTRNCFGEANFEKEEHCDPEPVKFRNLQKPIGQQQDYKIYGMDCPACAATIEKSLGQIPGVQSVAVNYSTGKMQVTATNQVALERVPMQVKKIGYKSELIEVGRQRTYVIEGMDCGACARTVENHLRKLPGVRTVAVNFSTGKMIIEHDNSVQDIISEVSKAGYKAITESKHRSQEPQSSLKKSSEWFIFVSGILLVLGFVVRYLPLSSLISVVLFGLCIVIGGYKPARSAYYAIRNRSLDMNVLMTLAATGAAIIGQWAEGASVVWLFALGNVLQSKSIEKTRNSIRSLINLTPLEAWVKMKSEFLRLPVEEVEVGNTILVKPGERVPLDGEVVRGTSSVNQAPITGESIPVDKRPGDPIYAGTMNENGSLEILVTKLSEDSTVSRIIHMVEEAQEKKAPTQAVIDKFAQFYTPAVFILAVLVMVVPPLAGFGTWVGWIYKGLELLVVACPCALVISTPVALVSAIGNAAKNGILIKGGTSLETAGKVTAIAFDKTGTLTEGAPKVVQVFPFENKDYLLAIARTLEEHSTHPIAYAIVQHAKELGITPVHGEAFGNIVGKGVTASIDGIEYFVGNLRLFQDCGAPVEQIAERVCSLQNEGYTTVIIGKRNQIIGYITVADTVRNSTASTIQALKHAGVRQIVMLTGDNEGTAKRVAEEVGVSRYYAELLPEGKVDALKDVQQGGSTVAMVGDGINDAPALATADIGIAMGGVGTDTAMETADIVLMSDSLEKLQYAFKLSKRALRLIKQNVWFSLVIKFLALVLIFPGWLTLWEAVMSDTGAAIIVILNSMRLLRSNKQV